MESQSNNVILFPKWKSVLEKESLQALKEKRYEEALTKLNKLLSYHVDSHEIVIGKLMCLMELGRLDEAQDICENLLASKSENYYHYVHIYLTILFQTNQFKLLMDQVEYEFEDNSIPAQVREQFQQLYDMSEKMNDNVIDEKSTAYVDDLFHAIESNNYIDQWRLVEALKRMKANPTNEIITLLVNEKVHPVIKTTILSWLRDKNISRNVDIHKLNTQIRVKPTAVAEINSQGTMKQIELLISVLEQKNPSLYAIIGQLLYRYAYVRYPIMLEDKDVMDIAEALKNIGEQYLNLHTKQTEEISENVQRHMEEIKMCESLYSSIIQE